MKTLDLQMGKADLDKNGRVLIPAALRHALNFHPGDTLVMRIINGELHIVSIEKLIKSTQELIASRAKYSGSMVDKFLQEKYEEAEKENARFV